MRRSSARSSAIASFGLAALCSSAGSQCSHAVLPIGGVSWQKLLAFLVQRNRAVRKQTSTTDRGLCTLYAPALLHAEAGWPSAAFFMEGVAARLDTSMTRPRK